MMTLTKTHLVILALLGMAVMASMQYEKNRANFYRQVLAKQEHSDLCAANAMRDSKAEFKPEWTISERMAYAFTSDKYRTCIGIDPAWKIAAKN